MNQAPTPYAKPQARLERLGYSRYLFEPVNVSRQPQMVRDLYGLFELQAVTAADWLRNTVPGHGPVTEEDEVSGMYRWQHDAEATIARWLARGMSNPQAAACVMAATAIELALLSSEPTQEQMESVAVPNLVSIAGWLRTKAGSIVSGEPLGSDQPELATLRTPHDLSIFGARLLMSAFHAAGRVHPHRMDKHGEELNPLLQSLPAQAANMVVRQHLPTHEDTVKQVVQERRIRLAFYARLLSLMPQRMAWDFNWKEPPNMQYCRLMQHALLANVTEEVPHYYSRDDADTWTPGEEVHAHFQFFIPRSLMIAAIRQLPPTLLATKLKGNAQDDPLGLDVHDDDITELVRKYPRETAEAASVLMDAVHGIDNQLDSFARSWVPQGGLRRVEIQQITLELEMIYRIPG